MGRDPHVAAHDSHWGPEQEYLITITGKNLEVLKPTREYIEEKLAKIDKFTPHVVDAFVRLEVQKLNHVAHIILKFSHFIINVHAVHVDMHAAIDKAIERLNHKLKKWKERIQDFEAKGISEIEMEVDLLEKKKDEPRILDEEIIAANNAAVDEHYRLPKVVKRKAKSLKEVADHPPPKAKGELPKVIRRQAKSLVDLTMDEAVMKMELSDDNFMVFRDEASHHLQVIYRRTDGMYGLISLE